MHQQIYECIYSMLSLEDNLQGIVVTHMLYLAIYVLNIYNVSHKRRACQISKLAAAIVKVAAACVLYWRPP